MDIEDALADLEAVGIGSANTTDKSWASTTITTIADNTDPNFQPAGTSVGNDLCIDANGHLVLDSTGLDADGWYNSTGTGRATLQMGALVPKRTGT
jgi:hypothetical protein